MLTTSCIVSTIGCISPFFAFFVADSAKKYKKLKKYVKQSIPKRLTFFHTNILKSMQSLFCSSFDEFELVDGDILF